MRQYSIHILTVVGILAALLPIFAPQTALAAGVVGNGNPASCDEAALDAALAGGGLVTFDCGPAQHTIMLTTTKVIANDTQIDGDDRIVLDMGNSGQHFYVAPPVTLQLDQLSIVGGSAAVDGGAIRNDGTLLITDSELSSNSAPGNGGAIRNDGTLEISDSSLDINLSDGHGGAIYNAPTGVATINGDSQFRFNLSDVPSDGGAIYNDGGTLLIDGPVLFDTNRGVNGGAIHNAAGGSLTVSGAAFVDNIGIDNGGAIHNDGGTVWISDTEFTTNNALDDGGAVYSGSGSVVIERASLNLNLAGRGAGIWNGGLLRIFHTNISDNAAGTGAGGGIFNASTGALRLIQSAVYYNSTALTGAGLHNDGTAEIETSTLSTNQAVGAGGGIFNQGQVWLTDSTLAFNTTTTSGGGLRNLAAATLDAGNTIIANNANGDCSNVGTFNTNDFNLDTDGSCPLFGPNDNSGGTANLGALALNGGATFNHMPGFGSDALDNGPATCVSPDQRGENRPRNGACEIGAVEVIPAPDVCYSVYTKQLQFAAGGSCGDSPYIKSVVFQEGGPHHLCANPYTGILSYGAGPVCTGGHPAIQMPAAAPLAVCRNPYTGQLRLPPAGQPCGGQWLPIILS